MSEWMNGAIRLNREQAVKLNHELNYPNRDVLARRDCFFAYLEQNVYVSPDYCTISVEIPGLTRQQLEDIAQQVKSQSIEDRGIRANMDKEAEEKDRNTIKNAVWYREDV